MKSPFSILSPLLPASYPAGVALASTMSFYPARVWLDPVLERPAIGLVRWVMASAGKCGTDSSQHTTIENTVRSKCAAHSKGAQRWKTTTNHISARRSESRSGRVAVQHIQTSRHCRFYGSVSVSADLALLRMPPRSLRTIQANITEGTFETWKECCSRFMVGVVT